MTAGIPVVAELNLDTGIANWAVPHGITNNISDIAILDDVIFSYENLEIDNLHKHLEANDFQAMLVGTPGIEAQNHAMSAWGELDLKVVANFGGAPTMYEINADTGTSSVIGALSFPETIVAGGAPSVSTREVAIGEVQFGSMDTIKLVGGGVAAANTVSVALTGYAFPEQDADFAVLLFKDEVVGALPEASINGIAGDNWAAIALIDADTLQLDYIVELQNPGFAIQAIALRPLPPAQVPTLSEWGMIVTTILLMLGALIFFKRRPSQVKG